jgi:mono/diheme cytochrome c family protein
MAGLTRRVVGAVAMLLALSPGLAAAQETADYFRQNCMSCHTIGGGRLTGPDLKNVGQRRDRDWLVRFILNPKSVIDGGDAAAVQLLQEYRGVVMPTPPAITASRAEALLDLIEAESKLEQSQFAGLQISDKPFTPADVARGYELFVGRRGLANGGPSCLSCHNVQGLGGLGGGRLGPDLTKVYERLDGRKPLASWLFAPATPTMRPVFKDHPLLPDEIVPLVAYLEATAQEPPQEASADSLRFVLLGMGGTVLGLLLIDRLWRYRLRGVRRPLVEQRISR